jgi:hypothetical protein
MLRQIKVIYELKKGNPRDFVYGPYWTRLGKGQRLTRTDEARIHLRYRPGDNLDRTALDASLWYSIVDT